MYSLDLRPEATGQGGLEPQLLLDDFEKPNGLAFSPDERTLYICDTARYHIRAFDVEPSGSLRVGSGRVFARMDPETPGGPDGVKVDRAGRVYAAVAQGVWVYEPDGRLLGIIAAARAAGEPGLVRPRRPRPRHDGRGRGLFSPAPGRGASCRRSWVDSFGPIAVQSDDVRLS